MNKFEKERVGLLVLLIVEFSSAQSCVFDFERDEELGDFNSSFCGGSTNHKPSLLIVNKPITPQEPPEPIGERGLTTRWQKHSCLISKAEIKMTTNQTIKVIYYAKRKEWSDYGFFMITVQCEASSQEIVWRVLESFVDEDPEAHPDGVWVADSKVFSLSPASACKVKIDLYRNNGFEVYVDKLEIVDPISSPEECYKVNRHPIPTTTIDIWPATTTTLSTDTTTTDDTTVTTTNPAGTAETTTSTTPSTITITITTPADTTEAIATITPSTDTTTTTTDDTTVTTTTPVDTAETTTSTTPETITTPADTTEAVTTITSSADTTTTTTTPSYSAETATEMEWVTTTTTTINSADSEHSSEETELTFPI